MTTAKRDRELEGELAALTAARFPGIDIHVEHSDRWQRMSVTFRWAGFADLLPEERFHRLQSVIPDAFHERKLRGFVWLELAHGETIDGFLKLPRSEDVAERESELYEKMTGSDFFGGLKLTEMQRLIAVDVLKEINGRLGFLCDVGLDYLALDRTAPTLSGGESQRIRLASQIGAGLVGVLYILDEPSIGLHARDNDRLLASLCRLRDMGNTVIVVEHDEATMRTADEIVDFGPGPGVRGGEVVAHGGIDKVMKSTRSITGKYLRGEEKIEVPKSRRLVRKG